MREIITGLLIAAFSLPLMAKDGPTYTLNIVRYPPQILSPEEPGAPGPLVDRALRAFESAGINYRIQYRDTWDSAMDETTLRRYSVFVAGVPDQGRRYLYPSVNTGYSVTHRYYVRRDSGLNPMKLEDLDGLVVGVVKDRITGDRDFDKMYLSNYEGRFKHCVNITNCLARVYWGDLDVAVLPMDSASESLRYEFEDLRFDIVGAGVLNETYLHLIFNPRAEPSMVDALRVELAADPNL